MEEAKWFENLKICTDADIALVVRIQESGVRIYKGLLVWYLSSQGEMAPVISRFFNNSDSCILTPVFLPLVQCYSCLYGARKNGRLKPLLHRPNPPARVQNS